MSAHSDLILFTVDLAVNLFLFGLVIAGSVSISFRLIKNVSPRLRYIVTVAAFLIAAFLPLVVTLNGSIKFDTFIEAKQSNTANSFTHNVDNRSSVVTPKIVVSDPKPESEKRSIDLLSNFTAIIADSFIGAVLFSLWILGSVCFLLRDIVAHRRLRKARQGWQPATNSERKELAFPNGTALYFGEESPATVGFFYPVIILPRSFPDNLSLTSKRYIVQHELAHAQWRDPLVYSLLRLVRSLFWLSPALWMLERIAVAERESAADYTAITKCSINKSEFEMTALNYASTLISIAKHFNSFTRRNSFKPNTIGLNNGSKLETRIRRLLTHSSKLSGFRISLASIVFLGSLIGLFFMPVAFQPKEMRSQTGAATTNNQDPENLSGNENLSDLSTTNQKNKLIQVMGSNEKKERNTKAAISNQGENEQFSNKVREVVQTQKANTQAREQLASLNNNSDDNSENLMEKTSEADAEAGGIQQKLKESIIKAYSLDTSRKDLESPYRQVRQRAASKLDSTMMQTQPIIDSNQNININININRNIN